MTQNNNDRPIIQSNGYNGSEPIRICPHCKKEKPISDFGFRNMGNGTIRNQSWCKNCRKRIKLPEFDINQEDIYE